MSPKERFRKTVRNDFMHAAMKWYRRTGRLGLPAPNFQVRVHPDYADPETGEVNGAKLEYRHIEVDVALDDETLPVDPDTKITRERKRQEAEPFDWLWGLLFLVLILYCGGSGVAVAYWGLRALILGG